ncbi:NADP-dependent oxidoreductase [Virgisporangium ochraceum]|uniref:NADPH:quinone reductase n=1 Tax=Virgisporangium ochraceum TaxID=65505 RepID=A0A8J4A3Z2_9ACTN|nr:NADP-dependent oxidoreductase [Virgisporangium ochraceum]GIJ75392.1 NADPH:quinone reductase [Virgisporangium ochraceum]
MRAVQIDRHGGIDVLVLRDVPEPVPRADEVLVRTVASSVNPVDWKTRAWDRGPAFPMTLGWDLAGVVAHSAVPGFSPGDRVVAMSGQLSTGLGTWADLVAVPARILTAAPARIPLVDAAALPLAGLTASQALERVKPVPGERVLVTGGVGGVGSLAVQLARRSGARVDALVSRPAHVTAAREAGAHLVTDRVGDLPPGAYDAVLDTAGVHPGPALAPGGRYVSITDDPLPTDLPNAAKHQVREDADGLADLVTLVDARELRVRVGAYLPVGDVRRAHELFEAGGMLGKVVLTF